MNIYKKYKELSMFEKIGLWESIASIVALAYSFASTAGQTTQNINGKQNTVIGENHGDINSLKNRFEYINSAINICLSCDLWHSSRINWENRKKWIH